MHIIDFKRRKKHSFRKKKPEASSICSITLSTEKGTKFVNWLVLRILLRRAAERGRGFWFETCKQEGDERPRPQQRHHQFSFSGNPSPASRHLRLSSIAFFFLVFRFFLQEWSFVSLRTIYCVVFVLLFPLLNKTICFILHNTIKPLHVQYQCPITDYMYGKLKFHA